MASAPPAGLAWLEDARREICRGDAWAKLTAEVYAAVHSLLIQNNLLFFTQLKDEEKLHFIDRAVRPWVSVGLCVRESRAACAEVHANTHPVHRR